MTRVLRNAALACAAGILVASAALANVPDPNQTKTFNGINPDGDTVTFGGNHLGRDYIIAVSGQNGSGTLDICEAPNASLPTPRCNPFWVTVADFQGTRIAGADVSIDFTNCSDIDISCTQQSPLTVGPGRTVHGVTDVTGRVLFKIMGSASDNTSTVPSPGISNVGVQGAAVNVTCAQLYASSVPIKALCAVAFDQNGYAFAYPTPAQQQVNGTDASIVTNTAAVRGVLAPANRREREDINMDGNVTGADAAREKNHSNDQTLATGATSTVLAPGYCP